MKLIPVILCALCDCVQAAVWAKDRITHAASEAITRANREAAGQ